MKLRYYLDIAPPHALRAQYALSLLLEGLGVAGRLTKDPTQAHLAYAPTRPPALSPQAVWIPADAPAGTAADSWDAPVPRIGWLDMVPMGYRRRAPQPLDAAGDLGADLLYATYVAATGRYEHGLPRNAWGVPEVHDAIIRRTGLLDWPLVASYTHLLGWALERSLGTAWQPVPRWPEGKRYAIVLSHDVDKPFAHPSAAFYRRRWRRDADRGAWKAALRGVARWGQACLREASHHAVVPEADPNFCFDAWRTVERRLGTTAAFYVAVTTAADPTGAHYDVDYDFRHPAFVRQLRRAIDAGWEVGLHASINARLDPFRFQQEKQRLEAYLGGYRLQGVRHHHWSLDPDVPTRTWRAHAAAGFRYDSSLGLNDSPGFRRGMCWPYNPFDPKQGRVVPLLQVPPTLMDGAIYGHEVAPQDGLRQLRDHITHVAHYGGAAVLDWHLEQLNPARLQGAGPALVQVLQRFAGDSDIFWTSPAGLAEWWQERRRRIDLQPMLRLAQHPPMAPAPGRPSVPSGIPATPAKRQPQPDKEA